MTAYTIVESAESYKGEQYRLDRRELWTMSNARGYNVVWTWEVLTGPGVGQYGGKCGTKAEARKAARQTIAGWAEEAAR